VSYFGNMGTVQDMETIRDAVCLLKNDPGVFFLFAGHGNKLEAMKRDITQAGVENIRIFDFLHGEDFRDALRISDCALVCLDRDLTGTCVPSKTYSYMMQGLPLLAIMDEGDIVSDIASGAGMWVRNGESEKLAQCIRTMRENSAACVAMGKRCRELFLEKYTTPICTEKYVQLFRRLLREK